MQESSPKPTDRKREVKPVEILYMLLLLNVLLGAVVLVFPEGKLPLGKNFSLQLTPLARLFTPDTSRVVNIKDVIAGVETVDTTVESISGSVAAKLSREKIEVPLQRAVQFGKNEHALDGFFAALAETERSGKLLHIIHYGDSQLEGDRVSDYLRNRLQLIFGGYGPGVVLPMDISRSRMSVLQSESSDWVKYAVYGKTQRIASGLYGIGASSYKYTGKGRRRIGTDTVITKNFIKVAVNDSIRVPSAQDSSAFEYKYIIVEKTDSSKFYYDTAYQPLWEVVENKQSWVRFNCAKGSYPRVRKYNEVKVLYTAEQPFEAYIQLDDSVQKVSFEPAALLGVKTFRNKTINKGISLSFSGESPYFHGFVLQGDSGVQVDNFPMRGSSGTGFEMINPALLAAQFKALNARLVIMQYGINVVPNPQKNYDYYQRLFAAQLKAIKQAVPGIAVLVIGPSDMSTRINGEYASYPNITLIRDAMRNAAFDNGCAFWDLFEAMGGQNSMVSWVNETPPLAGKDFTHFTSKGAQYVGEMLYDALMKAYLDFKQKELSLQ